MVLHQSCLPGELAGARPAVPELPTVAPRDLAPAHGTVIHEAALSDWEPGGRTCLFVRTILRGQGEVFVPSEAQTSTGICMDGAEAGERDDVTLETHKAIVTDPKVKEICKVPGK